MKTKDLLIQDLRYILLRDITYDQEEVPGVPSPAHAPGGAAPGAGAPLHRGVGGYYHEDMLHM